MEKKEAMKILKDFYDKSALFSIRTALDTVIPELKESKDEKIRKTLINFFDGWGDKIWDNEIKYSEVVAWLQKQGAHANFRNKIQAGDHVTRNDNGELVNLSQLERVAKQSEPVVRENKGNDGGISPNSAWSEEDEKKRSLLISILKVNHPNDYFKVNPANTSNMEAMSTKELVDWLKSLKGRYTWKPTKNQIDALFAAVYLKALRNTLEKDSVKQLEELYNQLKKLK